jgi:hypothetical protein
MNTLALKALEIAKSQLGKQEEPRGSNWGPDVKKYLASVGIMQPSPWCMAFVYWCFQEAAKSLGVRNPLLRTGRVALQWELRKATYSHASPEPGDVFIIIFKDGTGHAGFVDFVKGDFIETAEGNSNDEGAREGFEVCAKPGGRHRTTIRGFLRFP